MIHDEKTTEIELPTKKAEKDSSIIHVQFPSSKKSKSAPTNSIAKSARFHWIKDLDLSEPWVIRLIAVLGILILSMLVL